MVAAGDGAVNRTEAAAVSGAVLVGAIGVWAGYTAVAEPPMTPDALAHAARALLVGVAGWGAIAIAGRGVWAILERYAERPRSTAGFVHDLAAGLLLAVAVHAVLVPLGAARWGLLALAVLGAPAALVPRARVPLPRPSRADTVALAVAALLLAPGLLVALAPPTDTDELYGHLAAPVKMLREQALPGGWLDPVSSRPLALQLVYAGLYAAGGPAGVKVFHALGAWLLVAAAVAVARAHAPRPDGPGPALAALLLAGSWTFLEEAGLAHDNLPTALVVLAAADAALRGAGHTGRFGLAAGLALAFKYTAAPAVVALAIVAAAQRFRDARDAGAARGPALGLSGRGVLVAAGLAAVIVAPWWLRNALDGLHPLFPYAGWPADARFVYAWPEKYGDGRDVAALLRLPWALVFRAETDSFRFLGRLHPLWLYAAPLVALAAVRDATARVWLVAVAVALVGWFAGVQWMRHLLPLAPLFVLAWARAFDLAPRGVGLVAGLVWALLLPPQATDALVRAAGTVPVVGGRVDRDAFLRERVAGWPAIDWVNRNTPADATVALLFAGEAALLERRTRLGSVEDHTPSRWFVHTHGDRVVAALRDAGIDVVVLGRVGFLARQYPFLAPAEFEAQFRAPERRLRDALAADATLTFEQGRYSVWDVALDAREARQ